MQLEIPPARYFSCSCDLHQHDVTLFVLQI